MLKKKIAKVLTGVLALSMLSGCGSASKMAMESAYDTAASNYSAAGGVYYDSGDYEYADEVSEENGSSQARTVRLSKHSSFNPAAGKPLSTKGLSESKLPNTESAICPPLGASGFTYAKAVKFAGYLGE